MLTLSLFLSLPLPLHLLVSLLHPPYSTEFDDVGASFFEGEDDVDGSVEGRVACTDVGDEGAFAVSVELLEAGVDSVGGLGGGHGRGLY